MSWTQIIWSQSNNVFSVPVRTISFLFQQNICCTHIGYLPRPSIGYSTVGTFYVQLLTHTHTHTPSLVIVFKLWTRATAVPNYFFVWVHQQMMSAAQANWRLETRFNKQKIFSKLKSPAIFFWMKTWKKNRSKLDADVIDVFNTTQREAIFNFILFLNNLKSIGRFTMHVLAQKNKQN